MHVYVWVCARYSTYVYVSQRKTCRVCSLSIVWVPEIKFKLSALMTSASFTQPSC